MMIPKATKEERERIEKELMEIPGMLPPTGGKGARGGLRWAFLWETFG